MGWPYILGDIYSYHRVGSGSLRLAGWRMASTRQKARVNDAAIEDTSGPMCSIYCPTNQTVTLNTRWTT